MGSNWSGGAYPGADDYALLDTTASLSTSTVNDILAIRIGTANTGTLNIYPGAALLATANSSSDSQIGSGSGNQGTVYQTGGTAAINYLEIGRGGTGLYVLAGGGLIIARGQSNHSVYLGTDDTKSVNNGNGTLEISGGSFLTRTGVHLGSADGSGTGIFSVLGSMASTIGIGSQGTIDGSWTQYSGSILNVGIDTLGVTKILVDEVDGTGQAVTFEAGSLLNVDYYNGGSGGGTWTVMELENADIVDNGLAFASGVDTDLWSFHVTNGLLTVSATGTPVVVTDVNIDSIAQLRQYGNQDNMTITMTPGTYWMESEGNPLFLHFSGSNTTFDLTGVIIKMKTIELDGFGDGVNVLNISGDHVVVDGLTLTMVKDPNNGLVDTYGNPREYAPSKGCQLVRVTGSDTTIKNCTFTTGGSYPYGYGDAFGKGSRPSTDGVTDSAWISHSKQSGFLITGGAANVTVDGVILNMRSYGHGFFFQQGAHDLLFKDCQVLGDTMAESDDIIAHPEYQEWGYATYKEPIPAAIRISKHEGAFRTYGNAAYEENGFNQYIENITITNCRVERMRNAVAMGAHAGYLRVYDTVIEECEMGFGSSRYGDTLYQGCTGDAVNGPLIYFQYSVSAPATYEVELTGETPSNGVWPIALISGTGNKITLTSSAMPGVYSAAAYLNTSQKWREWRHRPSADIDELSTGNYGAVTTGNFITNLTEQILVFGPHASGNAQCVSTGGIINKGTDNEYRGETLVLAPIIVEDTWSFPPNSTNVPWAQWDSEGNLILPTPPVIIFDGIRVVDDSASLGGSPDGDGGTTVSNGTLEVASGFALQGEDVVLFGSGTAGQGAVYSEGKADNTTRLSSSSGTLTLAGDTSMGVGVSGNQLLLGPIAGTGSLTKIGPGTLTLEGGANSYSGSTIISQGWIKARSNKVEHDLQIAAGAGLIQNGSAGLNQGAENYTVLDGTLDINGRSVSDTGTYEVNIGSLSGGSSGWITSTSTAATQTVNIISTTLDSAFDGTISGTVRLNKNGAGTTLALNGSNSHTGGTFVNAGRLGGTGTIRGEVTVAGGAGLAPGNGIGTLTTGSNIWNDGVLLDIEIGASANDLLVINGTLSLIGTSYQINLSAADIEFNARAEHSWKVVDASQILGFSAENYTVDSSYFSISNPLEGGLFSVSESNGGLYVDFTPVAYTMQEEWRFKYFGTYSNSGDAADSADPDGDSRDNLLEYASGSDPTVFDSNSVSSIGITPDGTTATITFNRIADPILTYWVEAGSSLGSNDWNTIWLSTGSSNVAGSVTVEDPELISNHWTRFMQLKIRN